MSPDDPRHGTRAGYVASVQAGSPCNCCRSANAAYEQVRLWRSLRGQKAFVEVPQRVRDHLTFLGESGVGRERVAQAAGVGHKTVQELRSGKRRRARPETLALIMSVGKYNAHNNALVPAGEPRRLVHHLRRVGIPGKELQRLLGTQFWWGERRRIKRIAAGTARKVHELARKHLVGVPAHPW